MTSNLEKLSRHDLEAKIVKRYWEDAAFRAELLADPAGTFAKHLRVSPAILPRISVHDEAPGSWHIVLPARPLDTGELSESDLEQIAGGSTLTCVTWAVSVATLSVTISAKVTEEADCW